MKKTAIIFCSLIIFGISNLYSQSDIKKGLEQITPELLKKHIDYLASDELKGRNTPSAELDKAADYIAQEFASLGIDKVNGSYFQDIPLCTRNLDIEKSLLKISLGDNVQAFNLKKDFTPFEMTADTNITSSIVFAGYGITAPEYNYDDYKDIDVKGKIVLVLKHEPGENDSTSVFEGIKETAYSSLNLKIKIAQEHGAVGLLLVTDPLNHILLSPQGYPWPSLFKNLSQTKLPIYICKDQSEIPVAQVGDNVIKFLFGSIDSLIKIQKRIDLTFTPNSYLIKNSTCEFSTQLLINTYISKNVVGLIQGSDSKQKDEILVIGGHYDHVGYNEKYKPGEDFIFNGADDNASGTSGVMAVAKAFSKMKNPDRSVLFILFAGEEKGLYGSSYYTKNPLIPLEKTVAMLNLDMISRNGDSLQVIGEAQNPDLAKIVQKQNTNLGLRIVSSDNESLGGSDHMNFYKNDISAIFFFTGLHKDYHKVTDNPDSVDAVKAAAVSKLVFRTAWVIANEKNYYKINK